MKYVSKYRTFFKIAAALVIGLSGLLVWGEREDKIKTGRHPNSLARYALVGIWQYEMTYLSKHGDFARSLSKLKVNNRIDVHTIEFVASESNLKTVVYRAIPDQFNWMMVELNTYTIAIVKSNSERSPRSRICSTRMSSNIVPKIEISNLSSKNSYPTLKCSEGSIQISDP